MLLLSDLNFGLGRCLFQLLDLEAVLRDGRLLDVEEFSERHFIPLKLLELRSSRPLQLLFVLLQLRHRSLKVLCKQLQLMLDRDVLSYVTLVLLELLFESDTVLRRVHGHVRHGRIPSRLKIRTEFSQGPFAG